MILTIKLKDDIRVNSNSAGLFTLGDDYFQAVNSISGVFNNFNDTGFSAFANEIFNTFTPIRAFNSYHLADSIQIADTLIEQDKLSKYYTSSSPSTFDSPIEAPENLLNYFGFGIVNYPSESQFSVLETLKTNNTIDFYWIENKTESFKEIINLPNSKYSDTPKFQALVFQKNVVINELEIDLNLSEFNNRGKGATLIIFEQDATNDLAKIKKSSDYLNQSNKKSILASIVGKPVDDSAINHQINTLATIFSKPPLIPTDSTFSINGIAPETQIVIASVNPVAPPISYMEIVRQRLWDIEKLKLKNAILLFEFETDVFKEKSEFSIGTYPISIYPDITNFLTYQSNQNNLISLTGSGDSGINFEKVINAPWVDNKLKYNDLTKNIPSILTVGATKKDLENKFIATTSTDGENQNTANTNNISKNLDVYMYRDFSVVGVNNTKVDFGGTSSSVAVVAGIIAFLQGKVLLKNTELKQLSQNTIPITTNLLKQVFKNTFMKKTVFPNNVLTQTTLAQLWEECQRLVKVKSQTV